MYILCLANSKSEIQAHQQVLPEVNSSYPISKGKSYRVAGMGVWNNVLHYLIPGDYGDPLFIPAALFEPTTAKLPSHWQFATYPSIADPTMPPMSTPFALWGYGALLEDDGLARLVDGDLAALADFRHELGAA